MNKPRKNTVPYTKQPPKQSVPERTLQMARRVLTRLRQIPRRHWLAALGIMSGLLVIAHMAIFLWPQNITFSYAGNNCMAAPVLLPDTLHTEPSAHFNVTVKDPVKIAGFAVYASTVCINLTAPPPHTTPETLSLMPLGSRIIRKNITVTPQPLPAVTARLQPGQMVAPQAPLEFSLTQADTYFDYRLAANDKEIPCRKKDTILACDLAPLGLAQGQQYPVRVVRLFKNAQASSVLEQTVVTVTPVELATASIAPGEKIFGIPADMSLTFTKPLAALEGVRLKRIDTPADVPITTRTEGATLFVQFTSALPRSARFELVIDKAVATDGGYLPAPHARQFTTSGGPQVQSISIGNARVQPGSGFTLGFDSPVGGGQDLAHFIRVEAGGTRLASAITLRGKNVAVQPQGLGNCVVFTVKVIDGLKSDVGVNGGSGWQFTSRTTCQTTFSIGTSVKGRAITGYKFGNGPNKIIFVGTLHGDEKSATHTLNSFIAQLEAQFERIPAHRTIIVIPNVNPDGYAANTRVNAHGVDLNRNFPAHGWKSDVTMPDGSFKPGGGGSAPLSEPESRALANYISAQAPRLVLSYHSIAGLVAANEAGDSLALARTYGKQSGLPSYGNEASSSFHYDTTGAFEDWLRDARGIPGMLIELSTKASNEFNRHRAAMWVMATLP